MITNPVHVPIDLSEYVIERTALQLVSLAFCVKHSVIPVVTMEGVLVVAMADPFDAVALGELQIVTARKIEVVRAEPNKIREAIARYYGSHGS